MGLLGVAAGFLVAFGPATAFGQEANQQQQQQNAQQKQQQPQPPPEVQVKEAEGPHLLTPWGESLAIGGGVSIFTQNPFNNYQKVSGQWRVRLAWGTRSYLGLELGYYGQAGGITALGLDTSAALVGNGFGLNVRFNALPKSPFNIYAFSGTSFKWYTLANTNFNTSNVSNGTDFVFEIPVGGGVQYRLKQALFDLRSDYRFAVGSGMIQLPNGSTDKAQSRQNLWEILLSVGYEF